MNRGVALVEIVVVIAIIGVGILALYQLVISSRSTASNQLRRTQAVALAQEGMEAVRHVRDQSWSAYIEPLATGTTYYLSLAGSSWTLTTTNPGPIDGLFTRTVVSEQVNRDANSNISATGTADPASRKLTTTVSWVERGKQRTVSLATYLTNFLDN